ncbi:TIGR02449 family protein [Microbulbifer thermotolerans]|uniref:TIGR02449 family protein n=1 Tax=Microbulbifer thermotolerans TaxID=252514 RepID=A0A143HPA3_MICTH|nr:TIGR02449 family protein [Microbulbifer thermotolerans]AMX03564.1 TIGR02449 family protein [Microbulbifer thermotolerans]MCX2778190.1 TIGR02449 family protein [Microbulbifer thermotolerans]MCX2782176.1 TIGR02449 family protein [Microbulbifer thermotolerans]MCX2795268.1 TIGR02449 family protein [Microbulbifer thermotolerans]MCX2801170.1 TIGR02449 family protein [Microbulbifer thermotolerans]
MNKLQALESTVDSLIARCQQLAKDNRELRRQEADWQRERQRLIKNNEAARSRVEAMINRLKGLAQDS